MEQAATQSETKTYQLGGRTFTALPVVARQEKWLWPLIKPLFQQGETITVQDIFAVMGESITKIAAILLIPEGQTQVQKVRAGEAGLHQLETWLDETVSVADLGPVIADFFASGQQWKLLTGLAGPLRQPTTGSTPPSVSSPMAISSGPNGSGSMPGLVTVDAISNEAGSARPSSAPSWASAG
jgi:hypothetical protein